MSFFGRDFSALCATDTHCIARDTELDKDVGDGVRVERRSVLWLSGAAIASLLTGVPGLRAQDKAKNGRGDSKSGKLSVDQFLAHVYPHARRVVDSKGKDEEAYLMTVAAAMSRLAQPGGDVRAAMRAFRAKHADDKGARFPVAAVVMKLRPGGGFRHHDHRNYNGVIMGLEGECRIRNFDILGDDPVPAEGETFQIRETRDDLILPGRFSSLGLRRDNVHEFVAGKQGARVLDVFTFFGKGATSRYMTVEPKARDAERRIYDAAWKPRRRRGRR